MNKTQPWVHSWYADSLCFFLTPFFFIFLALFNLPPFRLQDGMLLGNVIILVLFFDWAHIFAQYHRIYSNPLESKRLKWIYPISYLALIPVMTVLVHFTQAKWVDTILVYFVVFHFIKQHFGFMKIYSKTDGSKTKREARTEDVLFYLSMFTPVVWWHAYGLKYWYKWTEFFFKSPIFSYLVWPMIAVYGVVFIMYVRDELARSKRNGMFNIPKNVSLLSAMVGWGLVAFISQSKSLIIFTVTFTHDLSYLFYVWFTARRDKKIMTKNVSWFSWWSVPGLILYLVVLIVLSDILMVIHLELTRDFNWNYWIWGNVFNDLSIKEGWLLSFGWALFFATQAHHYFIDRYLWKKEKDLAYQIKTGSFKVE